MKIEKGKFYRTRCGDKVEVLKIDADGRFPVIGCIGNKTPDCFTDDGRWYDNDENDENDDNDLIAEWTEPVEIPWSDYPTWCKWVAMDDDGEWYCYDSKPKVALSTWINEDFVNNIHPDYTPRNFTGDWTESLFERP